MKFLPLRSSLNKFSNLWIILWLLASIFADWLANSKPVYIFVSSENKAYYPVFYDLLESIGWYQWKSEWINKDWKSVPVESVLWTPVPFSPEALDLQNTPAQKPLSVQNVNNQVFVHYLGTDELGRDVLSGIIHGARISMIVGLGSALLAACLGTLLGSIAGFWGNHLFSLTKYDLWLMAITYPFAFFIFLYAERFIIYDKLHNSQYISILLWNILPCISFSILFHFLLRFLKNIPYLQKRHSIPLDSILSLVIEIKMSIPSLLLIMIISAIVKPSISVLIFLLAFIQWTSFARLARAEMLKVRNLEYIQSAKVQGFPLYYIAFKHALRNILPPLGVAFLFSMSAAILAESALSFLGLSISKVTWGSLLRSARSDISAWWLTIFPGICLFFTIYALNSIREHLQNIK